MRDFLTASGMNAKRDELATRRLLPSSDSRPSQVAVGQKLALPEAVDSSFRHPWMLTCGWDIGKKCPVALFAREGFVNGDVALLGSGEENILDAPEFHLKSWRDVQERALADEERIPMFFQDLGAFVPPNQVRVDTMALTVEIVDEHKPEPTRRLFAMDVWLEMARLTYTMEVTIVDGSGTSGQFADYYANPNAAAIEKNGFLGRVRWGSEMPKEKAGPTFMELLGGQSSTDEGIDRIMVATVYALSPEGWGGTLGSGGNGENVKPDETFTFHVAQQTFWNLRYERGQQQDEINLGGDKPFFSGLAWGMGDMIINQNQSLINDLQDRVMAALNSAAPKGHFNLA